MSTLAVAKKDFQDGVRSRALFVVTGLFAAFIVVLTYYFLEYGTTVSGRSEAVAVTNSLRNPASIFLPIIGTMLGYKAIVGERESGSLKFLLGLPHTRRDVMLGKLFGRSGTVAVTVLIGVALAGIVIAARTGTLPIVEYTLFTGRMVVLGIVFVAIAISFSAATRSATVATWGAVGLAILFAFLWDGFLLFVKPLLVADVNYAPPDWFVLLERLSPRNAFDTVATSGPEPFYLEPWFGIVIFVVWFVVPLGIAYLRFERGDLA